MSLCRVICQQKHTSTERRPCRNRIVNTNPKIVLEGCCHTSKLRLPPVTRNSLASAESGDEDGMKCRQSMYTPKFLEGQAWLPLSNSALQTWSLFHRTTPYNKGYKALSFQLHRHNAGPTHPQRSIWCIFFLIHCAQCHLVDNRASMSN